MLLNQMKDIERINWLFYFVLILGTCISCQRDDDSTYFNGEIRSFEIGESVKEVTLQVIRLDGANFGWLSVYDSLMFFMNPKLSDRFYNIFNVDTGEELGTFCNKGGGPEEVVGFTPIYQFFEEGNDLKTLLFAFNEEKLFVWNITQSIQQGTTIFDKIIPYDWRKENKGAAYCPLFLQNENTLLVRVESISLSDEDATLPFYQQRTIDTNKRLKNYSIYKKSIKNGDASIVPEVFFSSNDAYKPDGAKVVQAMLHLPQLNILDIETGQVIGCRMKGKPDFSIFKEERAIDTYYIRVQADDNYIYAVYWGKEQWERFDIPYVNTIHVFDWNGNFVRAIETDRALDQIWIDPTRNRLYVTSPKVDDVFYLDLDGILGEVVQ